jgi:hypothetical protein
MLMYRTLAEEMCVQCSRAGAGEDVDVRLRFFAGVPHLRFSITLSTSALCSLAWPFAQGGRFSFSLC